MLQTSRELQLSWHVQEKDFATLVAHFKIPASAVTFVLLEKFPRTIVPLQKRQDLLLFEEMHPNTDFARYLSYTSGRIFHEHGELRWEKQRDRIQVVYTGSESSRPEQAAAHPELAPDEECVLEASAYLSEPRRYLLFGERLAPPQLEAIGPLAGSGDFAEVRIPRLLRYPSSIDAIKGLKDANRLQLVVREYQDRTGTSIAYRFQGLEPFPEKSSSRQEKQ